MDLPDEIEKIASIFIVREDSLAVEAPAHDVVIGAGVFDTKRTSHIGEVSRVNI
jgi:hypothetical protein